MTVAVEKFTVHYNPSHGTDRGAKSNPYFLRDCKVKLVLLPDRAVFEKLDYGRNVEFPYSIFTRTGASGNMGLGAHVFLYYLDKFGQEQVLIFKNKGDIGRAMTNIASRIPKQTSESLKISSGPAPQSSNPIAKTTPPIAQEIRKLGAQALSHFKNGDYVEAIRVCDRIIFLKPEDMTVWKNRGICLSKLGKHEDAVDNFEKALSLAPGDKMAIEYLERAKKSVAAAKTRI